MKATEETSAPGPIWTPPGDADLDVLSYGMGTQSSAIALMSAAGQLPRLDAVVMADTGGELPEVYEYASYVAGVLGEAGIPFFRVTAGNLEQAMLAPVSTGPNPTPPLKILRADGSTGRINAYRCSYDYKRRLVQAKTKALCGKPGQWKRSTVRQWIGFSRDEVGRVKSDDECRCGHTMVAHAGACSRCNCERFARWRINVHPLVDLGWTRDQTIQWFAANGHPTPTRSACWFCPNSSNARWRWLREHHPDLWERACVLDEHCREGAGFQRRSSTTIEGRMYFHSSFVPLRQADLREKSQVLAEDYGIEQLFDFDCNGDTCGT